MGTSALPMGALRTKYREKKMKRLSITMFVFFLIAGCTGVPKKDSEDKAPKVSDTKEEPKETENQLRPEQGELTHQNIEIEDREKNEEEEIKAVSLITKEISYYADGVLDEYIVYTYRENSTEILKEEVYTDEDSIIGSVVYKYQNGNLVEKVNLNWDGNLRSYRVYAYNDKGQLVTESLFDENERVQSVSEYDYDSGNNKVKWRLYDGDGAMLAYNTYSYENDKNSKIDFYNPSGKLQKYIVIEYDESFNKVKESFFHPDGKLENYTDFEYRGGLLVSEKSYKAKGSLTNSIDYEYDDNGNIIKMQYFNHKQELTEIKEMEYVQRILYNTG
jgi:hypothetical protein